MRTLAEGNLGRLTSGIYIHFRLCSEALETTAEGGSESLVGSSETCSGSARWRFSWAKERRLARPESHPIKLSSSTAGGGRSSSDELKETSRSLRFSDRDSAEHVTTILGSAWPSSTASFSSSSSMWAMSSGSPLAGTRKLQRRPSASQISWTKIVSSDPRSRRRLNRCGAGVAVGSTGMMDARRRREDESMRLGLSSSFLVGCEDRMLSKWKGSSSSLSVGGEAG